MCDKEKQGEVSSDKTDSNAGSTSTGGQAWDIGKWVAQYCATQNPSERAELAKAIDAGRAVVLCNWLLKLHERIDAAGSLNALGRMVSVALHPGGQTLHTLDRLAELELFVLSKFEGGLVVGPIERFIRIRTDRPGKTCGPDFNVGARLSTSGSVLRR